MSEESIQTRISRESGLRFPGQNNYWDITTDLGHFAFDPRPIAHGGFSFIMQGDWYSLNNGQIMDNLGYVAAKVPLPNIPNSRQIIQAEFEVMSRLDHPGILQPIDLITQDLRYFGSQNETDIMLMPWINAPTLYDRLKHIGHFDISDPVESQVLISIIGQLASTLDYAHQQEVVYGDFSTTNIYPAFTNLSGDNPEYMPHTLLADFGRSSAVLQNVQIDQILMGRYDAPEVAMKPVAPTRESDLYSFGSIVYEMITGWHPFDPTGELVAKGNNVVILAKVLAGNFSRVSDHLQTSDENFDNALDDIFAKILAKNPRDRFSTAREFVTSLIELLVQ